MKYTLINRKKFTFAKTNSLFVKWMRQHDMIHWSSNKEFMENYCYRKATFEKIDLRPDDEEVFVEDLKKNKLLSVEPNKRGYFSYMLKNFFK